MSAPATSPAPRPPTYRCASCGARWTYREIQHLARCRDCGGGLERAESDARPTDPARPRPT